MRISMIGFGNMAKAIAQGLMLDKTNLLQAASPSLPIDLYQERIKTHYDNLAVIAGADVIILAVKPTHMAHVTHQINTCLPPHCVIISIAAGLSLNWFSKHLHPNTPLIRAMPNIGAATGNAATPLIANEFASELQKQAAERIFSSIGLVSWLKCESEMNAYTALSGSGPAYVFFFMEALIQGAIALGLTEDVAKAFTLQTVKGALSLAATTDQSLTELRKKVTSPAGTTAAALEVLSKQGFEKIISAALQAANNRAQALEREQQ
jgi:pyrroline-5-carboxylate reductase